VRDYELVLVISPAVGDEGFPTTVERVSNFIKDRGGQVKDVDQWGRRRLAYPITRFTEGFYSVTHFSLEPTELRALEGNLGLAEDVLRHLVVRQEEAPLSPLKDALVPDEEEAPVPDDEEASVVVAEEEAQVVAQANAPSGKEQ
jgi:small subunit ribosomal protein S6